MCVSDSNISKSPYTKVSYSIPLTGDKKGIRDFLEINKEKKIVVVQGLGFVGAVMALVVANSEADYAVIGVDLPNSGNYWKIADINGGRLPIESSDQKIPVYFQNTKRKGNFYATYDSYVYSVADVVIVDINLDVDKTSDQRKQLINFDVKLDGFKQALKSIAVKCKEDVLVLIETTVPPGTCEKIAKPIFDEAFTKRGLVNSYKLAHSYERVMPGPNYVDSIVNYFRVYSGIDEVSANVAEAFLKTIISTSQYPLTRLKSTNATEMAKVLENSFRAMNIAFIQEWTEFAESAGVDLYEVIDAIRMRSTHKNIMRPGLGVGGYCLTKDPLLASWSSQNFFNGRSLPQSEQAVKINDQMPLHSFQILSSLFDGELSNKNVLILGVSYLNDVGDTRYSPVELLYKQLENKNANLFLHDPYVRYWNEMELEVNQDLDLQKYDAVVVTVSHEQFTSEKYIQFINDINPAVLLDTLGCYRSVKNKIRSDIKLVTIGKG
jgi:UDP-N-acetyl-D-glucosamine dehydrogenase